MRIAIFGAGGLGAYYGVRLLEAGHDYDALPEGVTASLQRDIMAGRPSELEAWSGAVSRLGAEAGVETPVHTFTYHALLPMARVARGGSGP